MSATEAVLGYQSYLYRENTLVSPPQMVKVAEVRNIGSFGAKRSTVEVTHMDSPDKSKEFISTLKEGAEFSAMCNMLMDATQSGLIDDVDSGDARNFQLVLPNSLGTFDFAALVLGWEISPDPNNPLEVTFNFKVSGPISIS